MMMSSGSVRNRNDMESLRSWGGNDVNGMQDIRDLNLIKEFDQRLLKWLVKMHNTLGREQVSVDEVGDLIAFIKHYGEESENEYIRALLYPEMVKDAKIPSLIPLPTSSFQLHSTATITTNSLGNFGLAFVPFFLTSTANQTSLFINNDVSLSGTSSSAFFLGVDIGQVIPAVYNQYRLVSGSIVLKYNGRFDIVSGTMCSAIAMNTGVVNLAVGANSAGSAQYGNFNLIDDSYGAVNDMSLKGQRALFIPLDESYNDYFALGTVKAGETIVAYGQGLPPSSSCIRIDIYLNFECLAEATFLNYVPTTVCKTPYNPDIQSQLKNTIYQNPVSTLEDAQNKSRETSNKNSLWGTLKKYGGKYLPSIAKVIGSFVPGNGLVSAASELLNSVNYGNNDRINYSNQGSQLAIGEAYQNY